MNQLASTKFLAVLSRYIMREFLLGIWNLIGLPGAIITTALVFYLGRIVGAPIKYIALVILHPWRLIHGHWLCPVCLGEMSLGPKVNGYGDQVCFTCLHLYGATKVPQGYVQFEYLRHKWNWRTWKPRATVGRIPTIGETPTKRRISA